MPEYNSVHTGRQIDDSVSKAEKLGAVSQSKDGLMSSDMYIKLSGIESGANNYILPDASTNVVGGVTIASHEEVQDIFSIGDLVTGTELVSGTTPSYGQTDASGLFTIYSVSGSVTIPQYCVSVDISDGHTIEYNSYTGIASYTLNSRSANTEVSALITYQYYV